MHVLYLRFAWISPPKYTHTRIPHSHGGVIGLRKLVLGQWCWGPRPALLAPSSTPGTEEEAKAATDASPTLHPLRQLLAAPAVAGSLEELDLLQARLLPGEIEVRETREQTNKRAI